MRSPNAGALAAALLCSTALSAQADAFNRIASFATPENLPEGAPPATETSAEIIAASEDGMTLVYSDSPLGAVGLIDISDPANPKAGGSVDVEGEPTSVIVVGDIAYAMVNTSESYTEPLGYVAAVDLQSREVTRSCDLGGQPDSVAKAADRSFLAVAIENERDEDLNEGRIPQAPAGHVAIIPMSESGLDCDAMVRADLTGLAEIAPEDPEPEFVAVNSQGEIAVTLQENNHVVVLNAEGEVLSHFSAGATDLEAIDREEDGALSFADAQTQVLREPDAVQWIGGDRLVTANEGDYEGGSRGFTVFSRDGEVLFESGASFEYEAVRAGHYPEGRSDAKGVEPEGMEVATFGDVTYMFLLSERGSVVGVYDVTEGAPEFTQLLPSGISPEGAVAIPERGLLATANEVDLGPDGGVRAHVMIYELQEGEPQYPTLLSADDAEGRPIGWGAQSGLAADPEQAGRLYAVSDSVYASQPAIFVIDTTQAPATITEKIVVTRDGRPADGLDLEGIVADGQGGFWLASEGRTDRNVPHALYRVSAEGEIQEQVDFPAELLAHEIRYGAEGVTKIGDRLWIAIQREWGDDPEGQVKLVSFDTTSGEWGAVRYPLETPAAGWVGLSEIAAHGDHVYVVERDNQIGEAAALKALYRAPLSQMRPAPLGGDLPVVEKELVRDLIPDLQRWGGYIVDKVEGFTVDASGTAWVSTDNDGVDDSSGETFLWSIGRL